MPLPTCLPAAKPPPPPANGSAAEPMETEGAEEPKTEKKAKKEKKVRGCEGACWARFRWCCTVLGFVERVFKLKSGCCLINKKSTHQGFVSIDQGF